MGDGRTPDLNVEAGDGVAGLNVDDLGVDAKEDALLVLDVVLPDKLAADIYRRN